MEGEGADVSNQDLQRTQVYLDPEGGYPDQEAGRAAEIAAMTR